MIGLDAGDAVAALNAMLAGRHETVKGVYSDGPRRLEGFAVKPAAWWEQREGGPS